jgi:hypothetical protein
MQLIVTLAHVSRVCCQGKYNARQFFGHASITVSRDHGCFLLFAVLKTQQTQKQTVFSTVCLGKHGFPQVCLWARWLSGKKKWPQSRIL